MPHRKPFPQIAALVFGLAALPAQAEMTFTAKDLLAAPETALGGAILACAAGAPDPAKIDTAFGEAGWTAAEGEGDGTASWEMGDIWVLYWTEPGFCMVADEAISTAEMETTLLGLTDTPPTMGTDEDGCTTYDLGTVVATLTSSGNDPVCTSDNGAALRFSVPE